MSHPGSHSHHENQNPHWSTDTENRDEWVKGDKERDMIHVSAKAMDIIWGNDQRFWQWVKLPKEESCFEVGAELVQVNWIEATGSLDVTKHALSPAVTYEVIYMIKFKGDAFGWHSAPMVFEVSTPDGKTSRRTEIVEPLSKTDNQWHEVYGGEFSLVTSGTVKFGMKEVQTEWWKGGLVLEGVVIRPKPKLV